MKKYIVKEKTWVRQMLKKYEAVEKRQPKSSELDSMMREWPKWVDNLWTILFKVSHPGLHFQSVKKWTAKDLGRFLGRQSVLEGVVGNKVPLSARVRQEKKRWMNSQARILSSNPELVMSLKLAERRMKKWIPLFHKFINETLASARKRPYRESSAFLEAFGKANVIKPDDLASERTIGVGERIAYVMFVYWRYISKFESVGQLHRWLSDVAKPMGIAIELKRVEKLCQRIGLKFKGRGRPKGKSQTVLPVVA